jgi:hypothetical protein
MARRTTTVDIEAPPVPTTADLDRVIEQLRNSWTARLTIRRTSEEDARLHQIYVSLDGERLAVLDAGQEISKEITPGPHRLRVHNTLFWKTIDFTVALGEHASFVTINRKGFGTWSMFAYFIGTNVVYLTVDREAFYGARR